jgi:hypothetical protein
VVLFSCQKEELPVPAHEPGNVITTSVNMNSNYKYQIYYDLSSNTIVSQNLKTSWDMGFETSSSGYRIILNTSKAMFARNTNNGNFTSVTDTNGFTNNKRWDAPSGNLDSTAIGDWRANNHVYVIDRGYSESGIHQGFRKIQFQSFDTKKYTIRFSDINGAGDVTMQIEKDSTYNFVFLSFDNGIVKVEPPKSDWDLCFTQYLHIFYNPTNPYLVTGCLLNRNNTLAIMDSSKTFSQIGYSDVGSHVLSPSINTIGYNWKLYNGATYITLTQMNYLIKDSEGYYYKLHFIDFYNTSGVKGNPKWEYQRL